MRACIETAVRRPGPYVKTERQNHRQGGGDDLLVLSLIWPALAFAHTRGGEAVGFVSGFEHSISGLDDVVAMIAVTGRAADSAAKLRDLALPARLHRR